jgi:hypothetical protein
MIRVTSLFLLGVLCCFLGIVGPCEPLKAAGAVACVLAVCVME